MIFSYYPGCTLKNKAAELDRTARLAAERLGFTLEELPEWQCCGGVFSSARDEIASKLAAVRALAAARDAGHDLVTLCSACHNVLKQANDAMAHDADFAMKANNYMQLETPYHGETRVLHYLEVLRDVVGWDRVAAAVTHPLAGQKVAAYYGCLLLRPGAVMAMDNPENPVIMEDFLRALGADPVIYPYRNECCGGYITLEDPDLAAKKSRQVADSAAGFGAQQMVTACPLCLYNIHKNAADGPEICYFTELLAQALGVGGKGARDDQ